VICLGVTAFFLFKQAQFTLGEKAIATTLISIWVVNCGVLFESKKWVQYSEWIRILTYSLLLIAATTLFSLNSYYYIIALVYGLVSSVWFYSISNPRNEKVAVA